MSSSELLKATQVLYLNVFTTALVLEQQYGNMLMPPKPGIYRAGDFYPSIEPNKVYYSSQREGGQSPRMLPIKDINTINDDVFDAGGVLVIPGKLMQNKKQYLKSHPTIPVRGLFLIESLIKIYLESVAPWARRNSQNTKISHQIKPEHFYIYTDGLLDKLTESLISQVSDFIGNDTWNIYFTKFTGTDILVEKACDWRVYMWDEEHGEKFREGRR